MTVIVQAVNFTAKPELIAYVKERAEKLLRFHDKVESVNVMMKLDNTGETANKICEMRVAIPGNDLFAERKFETFEQATNEVVDVLEQQLKRTKEKQAGH